MKTTEDYDRKRSKEKYWSQLFLLWCSDEKSFMILGHYQTSLQVNITQEDLQSLTEGNMIPERAWAQALAAHLYNIMTALIYFFQNFAQTVTH